MKKSAKRAFLWAATAVSLVAPAVAEAQSTEDEVIVTARRREESQQEIPLAVSALSADALERANVTDVQSLQGQVPSLLVAPSSGSGLSVPTYALRGLVQLDPAALNDPSVSLYINDIAVPRPVGGNVGLYDISSVQVARGPQGTLFGRNTTGGAVIVTTKGPGDTLGGYISQSIENFGAYNTVGAIDVPIGDALSVRIAGMHRESEGYIKDIHTGQFINYADQNGLRISADFNPTDTLNSQLVIDFANTDDGGSGFIAKPLGAGFAAQRARNDNYLTASGVPQHSDVDVFSATNVTTIDINSNISVRNIAGYREFQNNTLEDQDGTDAILIHIQRFTTGEQFSNEFQILGDQSWGSWIVGAFYFQETSDDQGVSVGSVAGAVVVDPGAIEPVSNLFNYPVFTNSWFQSDNTSYALFGQASFGLDNVFKGLSATLGVRYNWDERSAVILNRTASTCRFTRDLDSNPATAETNPGLGGCRLELTKDFSEPTYNLSLEYKPSDDVLLYAAHRHGYRSGGFGARASTERGLRRNFVPEIVDDVELGVKADWRINGAFLRTNLSVFHAEYADIQRLLTDTLTTPVTTVTVNVGSAVIEGGELEVLFRPTDWLELSGFWAHVDAQYNSDFRNPFTGANLSTQPFARAPANARSASARIDLPVPPAVGEASVGVRYFAQDEYSVTDTFNPLTSMQGAYEVFDFFGDWNSVGGSDVDLSFFVNNAFDDESVMTVFSAGPVHSGLPNEPRTYGVRVRYNFGE